MDDDQTNQSHDSESRADRSGRKTPVWLAQAVGAVALLTRIPLPVMQPAGAAYVWAFPLVGALVGLAGGAVFFAASQSGLGISSATLLAIASQIILTGGLHEDGLADTADGFGGGRTRESKLAIMRDSRIGTYGVLALILVTGLRFTAISEMATSLLSISDEYDETVSHTASVVIALVVSGAISRTAMALVWYMLPAARTDGLSASSGKVPLASVVLAGLIAAGLAAYLLDGPLFVAAAVSVCIVALAGAYIAHRQIGGHTGDVLGATQQVAEVFALLAISAITLAG